ncbi:hypothetical protein GCM10009836_69340 [Pseudonocardia ailaonensis]|uniref:Luciferase-like domain-containing protein n=1 Tax=Pseudonocardia ailaonensis TaxID=367279 RepID=A0ABN2NP59_9PSEU
MAGAPRPRPGIGVLFQGWGTPDQRDSAVLDEVCRATVLADRLGFDVAWFTEQHGPMFGGVSGRIAAPHLLIAGLAGATGRIGLGTAVRLVADTAPERVAEELATLDLLTGGRVRYGLGAGSARGPGGPAGRAGRRAAFRRAALELVGLLRTGGRGRDLGLRLPDLSRRLLVASVDPLSVELAAREGLGYFVGMFGGARHPDLVEGFRSVGGTGQVRAARLVHVAESDAAARRVAEVAAEHFWPRFVAPTAPRPVAVPRPRASWSLDDVRGQLGWVVGSPTTVARELGAYVTACALDGVDACFQLPGLPAAEALRSMELFATEVAPRLAPLLGRAGPVPAVRLVAGG